MPLLPVLTISLPLLGAGGAVGLSLVPRARPYTRYIALAAVGLTTVLLLASGGTRPLVVVPSLWQPSLVFGTTLALQGDLAVQPLALALALVTCGVILVELSRTEESHPRLMAILQAQLAAGFVTLWAANLLTLLVSWAIYDLLQTAGRLATGSSVRTAVRHLVFGGLAALLLWGGALLSGGGMGSGLWALMTVSEVQLKLWAAAGILRLWAYPFFVTTPDEYGVALPLVTPLALGPVLGWGLWIRIAQVNGGSIPGGAWMLGLAAVNLGVGGVLAWSCGSVRRALSWIGMGAAGAVLLAAGLGEGDARPVIASGGTAWALALGLLFLGDGLRREAPWWSMPPLVGALTLLGLPLTLGFVAEANLIGGLVRSGRLGWVVAFFLGNLFLVPSLVRRLLAQPYSPPASRAAVVTRWLGMGLPLSLLAVAGFYPPLVGGVQVSSLGQLFARPGVAGWLLWVVSLAGGGMLAWQDRSLRPRIEFWLGMVHDLLRLEWLYGALVGALDRGMGLLRTVDEVVGGTGAMLWSWLLFLLLVLIWGRK